MWAGGAQKAIRSAASPSSLATLGMTTIAPTCDFAIVRELFLEYASSLGVDLSFQDFAREVESLSQEYGSPGGAFLIAAQGELPRDAEEVPREAGRKDGGCFPAGGSRRMGTRADWSGPSLAAPPAAGRSACANDREPPPAAARPSTRTRPAPAPPHPLRGHCQALDAQLPRVDRDMLVLVAGGGQA